MHPRKNGYFYVRRRVPKDVEEVIGKQFFYCSLKTKDKRIAEVRALAAHAQFDQEVAEARLLVSAAAPKHDLKPKDIQVIADLCISDSALQMDETGNLNSHHRRSFQRYFAHRSDEKTAEEYLKDFLSARKLRVPVHSKLFKQLREAIEDRLEEVEQLALAKLKGDWAREPDVLFSEEHLTSSGKAFIERTIMVSGLLSLYRAEEESLATKGKQTTVRQRFREIDLVVRLFLDFMEGDVPVSAVTKKHAVEFVSVFRQRPATKKRAIKELPLRQQILIAESECLERISVGTVRKCIRLLQGVFAFGADRHYVASNPFDGALRRLDKAATSAPRIKRGYSEEELRRIFSSDLFRCLYRPVRKGDVDYGPSLFWIPLICYYSGARLNEVAQLHWTDIREEDGIWCIDINGDADDKRVKSNKPRIVPLHPHLQELGLHEYIDECREQRVLGSEGSAHRLFPMLRPNGDGDLSAQLSKILGRRFKAVGIASGVQPMHGLRHTFKTNCRRLGVAEDLHDALTGHSGASVGRAYGNVPVTTAYDVIKRLDRVGLPVSHYRELEEGDAAK